MAPKWDMYDSPSCMSGGESDLRSYKNPDFGWSIAKLWFKIIQVRKRARRSQKSPGSPIGTSPTWLRSSSQSSRMKRTQMIELRGTKDEFLKSLHPPILQLGESYTAFINFLTLLRPDLLKTKAYCKDLTVYSIKTLTKIGFSSENGHFRKTFFILLQ